MPPWFKPKTFHTFPTWVIVALEENLWAHYNFDLSLNMCQGIKQNDLAQLFRERADAGALDVDPHQLSNFWRDCSDHQRKGILDSFKSSITKEIQYNMQMQDE